MGQFFRSSQVNMIVKEVLLVACLATLSESKPNPQFFDLFNVFGDYDDGCDDGKSAVIFLQGLAPDLTILTGLFTGPAMGLSLTHNIVRSPSPRINHGGSVGWFSAEPPSIEQRHEELDASMERIEKEEIEYLINQKGICPENIVISGMSQGGALTIWMALFSKYKIGGFIPMITSSEWLYLEDW